MASLAGVPDVSDSGTMGRDGGGRAEEIAAALQGRLDEDFQSLATLARPDRPAEPDRLLARLLDRLYASCRSFLPYHRMSLAMLDAGGTRVSAKWMGSEDSRRILGPGYTAPLEGSSLSEILRSGEPRIIPDLVEYARERPGSRPTQLILQAGMRSSLTFPLLALGRPVGFLFLIPGWPERPARTRKRLGPQRTGGGNRTPGMSRGCTDRGGVAPVMRTPGPLRPRRTGNRPPSAWGRRPF